MIECRDREPITVLIFEKEGVMGHGLSHFFHQQSQDMPSTRSKAKLADTNDAGNAPLLRQTRRRKAAIPDDVNAHSEQEIKGIY